MLADFFVGLYKGQVRARQIATRTAATAEAFGCTFEDFQRLLEVKGVSWDVLLPRERTSILHLFQFGGAR